jgi:hypothetical protein
MKRKKNIPVPPASTNASDIANPKPLPPPVTTKTFPCKSNSRNLSRLCSVFWGNFSEICAALTVLFSSWEAEPAWFFEEGESVLRYAFLVFLFGFQSCTIGLKLRMDVAVVVNCIFDIWRYFICRARGDAPRCKEDKTRKNIILDFLPNLQVSQADKKPERTYT